MSRWPRSRAIGPWRRFFGDYTNLGAFRLEGTKAAILLRDDGSNLEDVLAKYLAPAKPKQQPQKATTQFAVGLDIPDAQVSVSDQLAGRTWQVQKFSFKFGMGRGAEMPIVAQLSAELPDEGRTAKITATMKMSSGVGEASASIDRLPLPVFRSLAARCFPGMNVAGRLSSEVRVVWGGAGGKNTLQANLATEGFAAVVPSMLDKQDIVRLERLAAGCQVSWTADRAEIIQSAFELRLGHGLACRHNPAWRKGRIFAGLAPAPAA